MSNEKNLEKISLALWKACGVLRGSFSEGDYREIILTILFLKYVSDAWINREKNNQSKHNNHRFLIKVPKEASFHYIYNHRNGNCTGEHLDIALKIIKNANQSLLNDRLFQDISFTSNKFGDEQQRNSSLRQALEFFSIDELNYNSIHTNCNNLTSEVFENLLKLFSSSTGKRGEQFYTLPEVSDLIVELLDPQPNDSICDPACGSASLLVKFLKVTCEKYQNSNCSFYGQEINSSTWSIANMNMLLNTTQKHQIEWGDTIRDPKLLDSDGKLKKFDIVASTPPLSLHNWGREEAQTDEYRRFDRGIPPKSNGDYAFILHMMETLKEESGRMAVLVGQGTLFRGTTEGQIRKSLIDDNLLDAVIGLPAKLLYHTSIPTVILLFKKDRTTKYVLFIDASREFKAGKNQNVLSKENITKIINTYKKRENIDKYSCLASFENIKKNDYNLNIPRYVDTFEDEEEIDLIKLSNLQNELKNKLSKLDEEMLGHLNNLVSD